MIQKWKIVTCQWCKKIAPMEYFADQYDHWFALPDGWKELTKTAHLCPECAKAVDKARLNMIWGKEAMKHESDL